MREKEEFIHISMLIEMKKTLITSLKMLCCVDFSYDYLYHKEINFFSIYTINLKAVEGSTAWKKL